jgi:protein unc-45
MTPESPEATKKATELAKQATALLAKGEGQAAARVLREAASIDPENPAVKKAWDVFEQEEDGDTLVCHCKRWIEHQKDDDGEEALDYIHKHTISSDVAEEAMNVMLEYTSDADMADQITGELLKLPGAKKPLAKELQEQPTVAFNKMFERGDDSMDGMTDLLFDKSSWPSEAVRIAAERDAFQLALAQMMLAGQDHPERAMKQISRLLGLESSNLKGLIDYDSFDVILSQFDIRAPNILRSQATVATAKLLELSPETSQQLISHYVVRRVERPTAEGLILAFSAAAAVFPMAPAAAATLFLNPSFLPTFVQLVSKWKSQRLEQAALELLSAACIDKACREAIRKYCVDWLNSTVKNSSDSKRSSQAGVILVKIQQDAATAPAETQGEQTAKSRVDSAVAQSELVSRFKSLIVSSEPSTPKQDSIEGLAYASITPEVKDELADKGSFLENLIKTLEHSVKSENYQELFGGLTILANITTYRPVQSEEQKRLAQLKDYAQSRKPQDPNPHDDDAHVTARCKKVLDAGAVPLLVSIGKKASPAMQAVILQTLNSLSKEQKHRGIMAQQGAVKKLLLLYDSLSTTTATSSSSSSYSPTPAALTAAHTLSRILISVNPSHVFGSSGLSITSAIRPLVSLLSPKFDTDSLNMGLLPVFESLLALTNLASIEDNNSSRDAIIRVTWERIEDLLLSHNEMVQRAAAELVCNLCMSPTCIALYADGSKAATNRLHVLLALADVEDLATRRAAGGALAVLTEFEGAAEAVIKRPKGVEVVLGLCADDSEELRHRGVVCVQNLVVAPGDIGKLAREKVKEERGLEVLREMVKSTRVREVVMAGVEVLKVLTESK